jgi:phosphatidylglycerol lysyltransferase
MAPMGFLVQLSPYSFIEERRSMVGELNGEVVGFLSAIPIYAREGWLLEHFLRDPKAPNGTVESMIDAAMRAASAEGRTYVTLGLSPLSGDVAPALRLARRWGASLFDFEGLRAFKAKLKPDRWEPVFVAYPAAARGAFSVYDVLRAFTPRGFVRFGLATLWRRPDLIALALAAVLLPWTVLLASPAQARRFPSPALQGAWALFDVALMIALFALSRRFRPWLGSLLGGVIALDACLTLWQAIAFNAPRARSPLDWAVLTLAVLAPSTAACLLLLTSRRPTPGSCPAGRPPG